MTKTQCCPVCSSQELSLVGTYSSYQSSARYKHMGKMGTFTRKDLNVDAETARFCLDCGYMLLFAGPEDIAQLRRATADKS